MFEVRYDNDKIKKLQRELRGFGKNSLPKVMSRGLTWTATQARTKVSRILSKRLGIKVGKIRERIKLVRATYHKWRAAHDVLRSRLPVILMRARQSKKGVTIRDYETRKRILIRHAFISVMPSGHKGVFRRRWPESKYSHGLTSQGERRKGRLPIDEQMGKPFSTIYMEEGASVVDAWAVALLQKNIHDQVQLILKRRIPA